MISVLEKEYRVDVFISQGSSEKLNQQDLYKYLL